MRGIKGDGVETVHSMNPRFLSEIDTATILDHITATSESDHMKSCRIFGFLP